MTTTKWKSIEPEPVALDSLVLQQDSVDIAALLGWKVPLHDDYPHVVVWQGQHYLSDGHHRTVAAALSGKRFVMARVLDMEDDDE